MSDGLRADPQEGTEQDAPFAKDAHGAGRWHTQSILGGGNEPPEKRGDCVRACITSILGLPLDAIENVHGENWWDRLQAEVARFGYSLAILDARMDPPRCYWIAALPSLVLPPEPDGSEALHCVVARGYELVHDPGMVKPGYTDAAWAEAWNDGKVVEAWALVPVDPCLVAVARDAVAQPSSGAVLVGDRQAGSGDDGNRRPCGGES